MIGLLNYPPTEEQLFILEKFTFDSQIGLTVLKFLSLIIFGISVWLIAKQVATVFSKKVALVAVGLLLISPSLWVAVCSYPFLVFKIAVVSWGWQYRNSKLVLATILTTLVIINILFLGYKPAILSKISFKDASAEVNGRFMAEDSLRTKIELPLWWRRISYNKYFMVYKQSLGEVLPFFDLETLFFQEVNPMEQKSVVMFYWPEVFLFMVGLYVIGNSKAKNMFSFWGYLVVVSLVNYLVSEGAVYQRLILIMLPISIIIGLGLVKLIKYNYYLAGMMVMVLLYGLVTNSYDLKVRPDFWLDNRPLVYDYWFSQLALIPKEKVSRVFVSTLVGDSKKYCHYYLGNKCEEYNFSYGSFDLSKGVPENGIYLGFEGEFIGSRFKNDFPENWQQIIANNGLELVGSKKIRDTVAFRYGNNIGLVVKK